MNLAKSGNATSGYVPRGNADVGLTRVAPEAEFYAGKLDFDQLISKAVAA
jgi:hypothetical protein